jgi:ABC-type dipeptide/oligopeptide/nickel transport system ATPase component
MYLKYVNYQNVGAVHNLSISLSFHENGNPKPIVFVGENGSGKSILLSNIVDAFYETANKAFGNVSIHDGFTTKYYKVISSIQISPSKPYMAVYLMFAEGDIKIEYVFKGGNKNWSSYNSEQFKDTPICDAIKWTNDSENHKAVSYASSLIDDSREKEIENIFTNNVLCYFPPDRYEKPNWLADSYHTISEYEHIRLCEKYRGNLYTPLTVFNPANDNLKWLLDVVVDSRAEVVQNVITMQNDQQKIEYSFAPRFNQGNLIPLMNARKNAEQILSDILGKNVSFELNMRDVKTSGRFKIVEAASGETVIPTFDSLSTGQMALFNLFITIIRYADYNDVNKSIRLNDISGMVVVDEVELHLHSSLQRDILPKLIKRFPKVQFIVTSHAPLFVLGMDKIFGPNGYELYQMPDGRKIDAEMFSEFQKAYDYLSSTQRYQTELTKQINTMRSKPLIVTEGKTDWIHIKAAYTYLKTLEKHKATFEGLDIDFFEYTSDMGDTQLCSLCDGTAKIKRDNIVIFIGDADKPETTKKLSDFTTSAEAKKQYKIHSEKVYSFVIPVPDSRVATPLVCIEHFYTDEIIKSKVECNDGVMRRLYIGGEFDATGMGENIRCGKKSSNKCGDGKIDIIDDDVYEAKRGSTVNIALPKKDFADKISKRETPFDSVDFESFLPIFEIIRAILVEGNAVSEQISSVSETESMKV